MWSEFKTFAVRGNVLDLAVAVGMGAAFGKVVSSLVENILTPVFSLFLNVVDVSYLKLTIANTDILYGLFLQSVLDFIFISGATFMLIRLINRFRETKEKEEKNKKNERDELLKEIRGLLKEKQAPNTHVYSSQKQTFSIHIRGKRGGKKQ